MTTDGIQVLHPVTGGVVRICRGPTPSGRCPFTAPGGIVPCAGMLLAPMHADPTCWPVRVPAGYRHCDLPGNERAQACLRKAENCRQRWQRGLERETQRMMILAAARDPRYRKMTTTQLKRTALWCWRLSAAGQALRRSEAHSREQAHDYLEFLKYRRKAGARVQ